MSSVIGFILALSNFCACRGMQRSRPVISKVQLHIIRALHLLTLLM